MPDNSGAIKNTIQDQVRRDDYSNPLNLMMLMQKASDIISPWWSRRRDAELKSFVKQSDHVSGAVYNLCAKMTAIPIQIQARNKSIKTHVRLAEQYTDIIQNGSQFGSGWAALFSMLVEDLVSQDNGAFVEIIGPGKKDGPLTGAPISIAHLDSGKCTRTSNPEFPVLYNDISGKVYKLHYSRVIFLSQMPSTKVEMNGVGFCAVSRALNSAQNLMDMSIYKQEKLGSRPPRRLLITGGGLDPDDVYQAVQMAEREMDNIGLSRFSKTIIAGNRLIPDPKVDEIDLTSMAEFNEKESTVLAMVVLAAAFGMDPKELFPIADVGATKADAIVQHMKQRGKAPGQIIEMIEKQLDSKVLPPILRATFDYQDDAQDRQVAEIRGIRSQARQRDLLGSITNPRVERQIMVQEGEISPEQFTELELSDGRLDDGLSVTILFASDDPEYKSMLSGVSETNAEDKLMEISNLLLRSKDVEFMEKAKRALAAINEKFIKPMKAEEEFNRQLAMKKPAGPSGAANKPSQDSKKPDDSYQDEKLGRKIGRDETTIRGDNQADL